MSDTPRTDALLTELGIYQETTEEHILALTKRHVEFTRQIERELAAVKEELAHVLDDWNAVVRASGSVTNGGTIGHIASMRIRLERAECELNNIARAKPSTWDDPTDFQAWAQSRARHILSKIEP